MTEKEREIRIRRKRLQRKRQKQKLVFGIIVCVLIVVLAIILIFMNMKPKEDSTPATQTEGTDGGADDGESTTDTTDEGSPTPEETPEATPTEMVELTEAQKYTGDLILVNESHEYHFAENAAGIALTDVHTYSGGIPVGREDLQLAAHIMEPLYQMIQACNASLGVQDTGVTSAYRSLEYQQEVYDEYVRDYGQEYADAFVATPGFSEHHTGLAMDLGIYYANGGEGNFSESNNAAWMDQNCQEYGFVRRYKEDKVDVTGISNEAWHFRYVGIPHAVYMNQNNLCLEEYIDYIRNSTSADAPMTIEHNGITYAIYSVKETSFAKPDVEYTVSGDNIDGYIVTQVIS